MRYLGIDLAWGEGSDDRPANRSGVVVLDPSGDISAAGWTVGLDETLAWVRDHGSGDCLLFVDAPLVISNRRGQRVADKQVGQRYGRWWVSANSVNLASPRRAGVRLRECLEDEGWTYSDGLAGPPDAGRVVSECYPYTTIVGAPELGYDDKRPPYKRKPRRVRSADFRPLRAEACDELIRRVAGLAAADPPIRLASHERTRRLVEEPSPLEDVPYKQREDLLDAVLCVWTAALWHRHGTRRCQVLGGPEPVGGGEPVGAAGHATSAVGALATMIAPARPEQRRP